jgi:hypothetical protein
MLAQTKTPSTPALAARLLQMLPPTEPLGTLKYLASNAPVA